MRVRHWIIVHTSMAFAATDVSFMFVNNCSQKIWPAMTGNDSHLPDPLPVNLSLSPGEHHVSGPVRAPWSGRAWARQGCVSNGTRCQVGDCKLPSCWGTSSQNTTLFEITITFHGSVLYDISLGMVLLTSKLASDIV